MRHLLWAALAVNLAAGPAAAASVVDQTSLPGDGGTLNSLSTVQFASGAGPSYGFAQSFTVGRTGRLDAIAFGLTNTSGTPRPVTLSLYAGVPLSLVGATPLAVFGFQAQPFSFTIGAFNDWSALPTIDLTEADLQVTAGQTLTFVLMSATQQYQLGLLDFINGKNVTYDGGVKYSVLNGALGAFGQGDFAFRTFVTDREVAAAPEPSTWALMISGFGLAGAGLRRRRLAA